MRWQRAMAWSSIVGFHCGSAEPSLDVQARTPGLDLADQDRGPAARRELLDHGLPLDRRSGGQRADRRSAEEGGNGVEHVPEIGEDHDLAPVGRRFLTISTSRPSLAACAGWPGA